MKRTLMMLLGACLVVVLVGSAYALVIEGADVPFIPSLETLRTIYETRQKGMDMWVEDTMMPPNTLKTWNDYVQWREEALKTKGSFWQGLNELKSTYGELIQSINDEFKTQAAELNAELTQLKAEQKEAVDAVKEGFKEEKKSLEAEISKLEKEQTTKLTTAKSEFISSLKKAIKEGNWKNIISAIKAYLSKRGSIKADYEAKIGAAEKKLAGLGAEEKKAIAAIEEEFKANIAKLEKQLAGLEGEKKQALDALKTAAEEEVRALCKKYGKPYQAYYLNYVFGSRKIIGVVELIQNGDQTLGADAVNNLAQDASATNYSALLKSLGVESEIVSEVTATENKDAEPIRFVPQMGSSKDNILAVPEK